MAKLTGYWTSGGFKEFESISRKTNPMLKALKAKVGAASRNDFGYNCDIKYMGKIVHCKEQNEEFVGSEFFMCCEEVRYAETIKLGADIQASKTSEEFKSGHKEIYEAVMFGEQLNGYLAKECYRVLLEQLEIKCPGLHKTISRAAIYDYVGKQAKTAAIIAKKLNVL